MKSNESKFNQVEIDDTYAEAFDGVYCRLLVTAERGLVQEDTNSPFIEFDPLMGQAVNGRRRI